MAVIVVDEQGDHPVDIPRWEELARSVLEAEGVHPAAELSMAFVDEDAMAGLNLRYAGDEGPTDVLAFPMDRIDPMVEDAASVRQDGPPVVVGDLVICPAVAARNAPSHAGTYEDELALLVVHGILHLMGMDHADEGAARDMRCREQELLVRFHAAAAPASHP